MKRHDQHQHSTSYCDNQVEKKMQFLRKLLSLGGCARLSQNKEVGVNEIISDAGSLSKDNCFSDQLSEFNNVQEGS